MHKGCSVRPCTSGTAWAISPTSSASGSPTLTSRTSAAPCSAASTSSCERSPACNWAWNALRPVGLIRSPMMQNGLSEPITTRLDGDSMTVSTHLPFDSGWNAELAAEPRDPRLPAKADQMQAGDTGQRQRVARKLEPELEALLLRILGLLAALDQLLRHHDP